MKTWFRELCQEVSEEIREEGKEINRLGAGLVE
jgi:hypothetical protein